MFTLHECSLCIHHFLHSDTYSSVNSKKSQKYSNTLLVNFPEISEQIPDCNFNFRHNFFWVIDQISDYLVPVKRWVLRISKSLIIPWVFSNLHWIFQHSPQINLHLPGVFEQCGRLGGKWEISTSVISVGGGKPQ